MLLTTEPARPERVRVWPHAWKLATATVCFGAFMGQLDASIVILTYKPLEHHFHTGPAAVQWVSLSYLLALVTFLAPMGRRSDRSGRKLSYLHGFMIFSAGSALCALAPDLRILVAARAIQGVGAALLQANSVAIVCTSAPREHMRAALGAQAAAQALGLALGPTAGGIIVATLGWRWVYAVNVPIGLLALVAGVLFLPRTTTRAHAASLDGRGVLLIGATVAGALLGLSALGGLALPGQWLSMAGLLAATCLGGLALTWHVRRAPDPVISPGLIGTPGVARGLVVAFAGYLVLFGPLVLVPAVLTARGLGALSAGLVLTSLPAGFALSATVVGSFLPRRWGDGPRSACGLGVAAAALGAMLVLPFSPASMATTLGGLGFGLGMLAPANNAAVMRSIRPESSASAGGIISMTRALGTAVGISAMTISLHLSGPRLAVALLLLITLLGLWALRGARPGVLGPLPPCAPIMPGHVRPTHRTAARLGTGFPLRSAGPVSGTAERDRSELG